MPLAVSVMSWKLLIDGPALTPVADAGPAAIRAPAITANPIQPLRNRMSSPRWVVVCPPNDARGVRVPPGRPQRVNRSPGAGEAITHKFSRTPAFGRA